MDSMISRFNCSLAFAEHGAEQLHQQLQDGPDDQDDLATTSCSDSKRISKASEHDQQDNLLDCPFVLTESEQDHVKRRWWLHIHARCQPCYYWHKDGGCRRGIACVRCHFCSEDRARTYDRYSAFKNSGNASRRRRAHLSTVSLDTDQIFAEHYEDNVDQATEETGRGIDNLPRLDDDIPDPADVSPAVLDGIVLESIPRFWEHTERGQEMRTRQLLKKLQHSPPGRRHYCNYRFTKPPTSKKAVVVLDECQEMMSSSINGSGTTTISPATSVQSTSMAPRPGLAVPVADVSATTCHTTSASNSSTARSSSSSLDISAGSTIGGTSRRTTRLQKMQSSCAGPTTTSTQHSQLNKTAPALADVDPSNSCFNFDGATSTSSSFAGANSTLSSSAEHEQQHYYLAPSNHLDVHIEQSPLKICGEDEEDFRGRHQHARTALASNKTFSQSYSYRPPNDKNNDHSSCPVGLHGRQQKQAADHKLVKKGPAIVARRPHQDFKSSSSCLPSPPSPPLPVSAAVVAAASSSASSRSCKPATGATTWVPAAIFWVPAELASSGCKHDGQQHAMVARSDLEDNMDNWSTRTDAFAPGVGEVVVGADSQRPDVANRRLTSDVAVAEQDHFVVSQTKPAQYRQERFNRRQRENRQERFHRQQRENRQERFHSPLLQDVHKNPGFRATFRRSGPRSCHQDFCQEEDSLTGKWRGRGSHGVANKNYPHTYTTSPRSWRAEQTTEMSSCSNISCNTTANLYSRRRQRAAKKHGGDAGGSQHYSYHPHHSDLHLFESGHEHDPRTQMRPVPPPPPPPPPVPAVVSYRM